MTSVSATNEYAIGVDIGGTKILVALVDRSGGLIESVRFPTLPEDGPGPILERIGDAVLRLKQEADVRGGTVLGVGVVSAGIIDSQRGVIVYAGNLNWRDVAIGGHLTERTGLPARLGNDANLAAVAEYVWGSDAQREPVRDLIYVTVSTGVGGGFISGGHLVEGASDSAGEFGHISTNPAGPRCGCGNYGCLENYSSGTAIAARANELLAPRPEGAWTSKEVMEAAAAGDEAAAGIVKEAAFHLGCGLTSAIHLFNPQRIVLGGGVMAGGDLLLEETVRTIDERCIPGLRKLVTIERSRLGSEIGALGAAGLFFMRKEPR